MLSIDESRGKGGKAARSDEFDPQLQQISALLKPKLEGIEDSANEIGFVTYQARYANTTPSGYVISAGDESEHGGARAAELSCVAC